MNTQIPNKPIDPALPPKEGGENIAPHLDLMIEQNDRNNKKVMDILEKNFGGSNFFSNLMQSAFVGALANMLRDLKGDRGEKGEKGDKGEKGEDGKTPTPQDVFDAGKNRMAELTADMLSVDEKFHAKVKGEKGDRGEQGEQGEKGEKGDSVKGEKGDRGEKGEAGKDITEVSAESLVKKIKGIFSYEDLKDWETLQRFISGKRGGGPGYLREISDVDTTNLTIGQVLQWNGTRWVPYTPVSAVNSLIIEKTSGTIDDSNVTFVFGTATAQPTALQINGVMYLPSAGAITWTWDQTTKTATLSSAVGTNGTIFGIV